MNNIPVVKLGLIAVSRDCFPIQLSEKRRAAIKETYKGELYECPVTVENEKDMEKALEDVNKAECNALVVFLGNFGPETPETLIAERFDGPCMYVAAAEGDGDMINGRGDAYCGMLNCSYNLKMRHLKAYIPEYPVGDAADCADMIHDFLPIARTVIGLSDLKIISFDPRDAADNGLTMEKAQALGLKFCEENFPGHPAIVCTHPDGHNHSGNIHVHIVIGSVRTREVERKPYMQKPRDWREGMKHSSTAQTMRHLRVEVMELCEGAGLYQIDLLNGSKERVSEAEYWARRRGQLKLDRENAALLAAGQQPTQTKFETAKEILRKQITDVLDNATNFEDFSDRLMQQYGIAVKGNRRRHDPSPPERNGLHKGHGRGNRRNGELDQQLPAQDSGVQERW